MDIPLKCRVPLEDIVKDISLKLSNGTKKVLIVTPSPGTADVVLYRLSQQETAKCEVRAYTLEEYISYRQQHLLPDKKTVKGKTKRYFIPPKIPSQGPETLEVDLYRIELT